MEPLEHQAVRLMVYRMVVVFTFFLSALAVQAFVGGESFLRPFYYLIAFILALNLLHLVLFLTVRSLRARPLFLYLQILGDILGVTLLCFLTGGFASLFTFLYQILIVVGGYLLKRRGAFVVASLDALLFGLLCVSLLYGWIDPSKMGVEFPFDVPTAESAFHALVAHYVGFYLVAALMGLVSGRFETARRALGEAELDLRRARMFTEQLVSSLTWGVITTDAKGTVTFSNPAGMRLLGETLPAGWALVDRLRDVGYEGPSPFPEDGFGEREVEVALPEGRHLGLVVAPLRSGASPVGFLVLVRDQTEVVGLREELALKDRLLAVGAMAADIAHEIKNPLGSISGAAQMLAKRHAAGSQEGDLFKIIEEESRRLSEILNNFMRYVKPPPLQKVTLDLRSLTADVVTLFKSDPECARSLEVEAALPEGPVPVAGDPDRLRQALWNLLQNARKAVPGKGRIRVALTIEGPNAILDVEDDGVGMRQDEIQSYFHPFRHGFRKGLGLGLTVVHQVAQEHEGRVVIRSVYGSGTQCRLILPAEAPHA